jgi:predicted nucleic acid-binding protein
MSAVLVDSNVLIYAHDLAEFEKQGKAQEILRHLQTHGNRRLSVQCLSEFFSITTRGKSPKLMLTEAALQVENFIEAWTVLDLTPKIILEAVRGALHYQIASWDAQIWASARLNQIPVVFSEDFNVGATLEGGRFVNPFAPEFMLQDWV